MIDEKRNELRKKLRLARKQLKKINANVLANKVFYQCYKNRLIYNKKKIAIYISLLSDGEFNTTKFITKLKKLNYKIFVPVVQKKTLLFVRYKAPLKKNNLKIYEPINTTNRIKPQKLDIIFMPLVGFDKNCNRLGMGGGFYDRTLAFTKEKNIIKPKLYGLAYECQKCITGIKTYNWDISLDGILTTNNFYRSP